MPATDIVHAADPNSQEALDALRHSAAHVMAQAVQELFPGTKITIGPAIENGFYYDFDSPHRFTEEDFLPIEKRMLQIAEATTSSRARKSAMRSPRSIGRRRARSTSSSCSSSSRTRS